MGVPYSCFNEGKFGQIRPPVVEVPYGTIASFGGTVIHNLLMWRSASKSEPKSVVATFEKVLRFADHFWN